MEEEEEEKEKTNDFFVNSLKVHIESSVNKYEQNQSIIFEKDFDNLFLNPFFINNINLFREIITKNELNFEQFWTFIGRTIKELINPLIEKFEKEIESLKENENEENKIKLEIGNINFLKLKMLYLTLDFVINEDSDNFKQSKNSDKEVFNNLLELYIKKEIEKNNDFTLFIKNLIIKLTLLINDNYRRINFGFLKFLSFTCYNFKSIFESKEEMNNLIIYIDQAINDPRHEIYNYLNGAFNKKNNKKEKFSRSRGASFDIRETNPNNNMEKYNKKIDDFFKTKKKESSEKSSTDENSGGTKETENSQNKLNSNNEKIIINEKNKGGQFNIQGKLHFSSHASNLSLLNLNSGLSNNSNSLLLNNSFSFNKNNNNSKISLDDSFSLTGIFSTPLSELNEGEENKNIIPKFQYPTILKCVRNKKKKPFERLKDKFFGSQPNIKKFLKIEDKKKEKEETKEMKEIRNMVNFSFYDNEKDIDNIDTKKKEDKNKTKNIKKEKHNKSKSKEKKDIKNSGNILIYKTPNKNDKENKDENIQKNIDISGIRKNWGLLFSQNACV